MNRTIIGKDIIYAKIRGGAGVIAGIHEVQLLDDGAVAVFNAQNGTLVTAANVATSLLDCKEVIIASGAPLATSMPFVSIPITRQNADIEYSAYIAPKVQVTYVGDDGVNPSSLNYPAAFTVGSVVFVKMTDVTLRTDFEGDKVKHYEYTIKTGDTGAIILAALITKINADTGRYATATTVGTTGMYLTAVGANQFEVIMGISDNVNFTTMNPTINYTTSPAVTFDLGLGSSTEVASMELDSFTQSGWANHMHYADKYWKRGSQVVAGTNYSMFRILFERWKQSPHKTELATTQFLQIALANSAAAVPLATLNTIFAACFSTTTQAIENGL